MQHLTVVSAGTKFYDYHCLESKILNRDLCAATTSALSYFAYFEDTGFGVFARMGSSSALLSLYVGRISRLSRTSSMSNESIRKKTGSYYVVSANKASSVTV